MKLANALITCGFGVALGLVAVSASAAKAPATACPADFKMKKATSCNCSAANTISCTAGGELMYTKNQGVDIDGTTLKTASGSSIKCDGSMWGVMMVHHHLGFKCQK